jgi:hypothetical protein
MVLCGAALALFAATLGAQARLEIAGGEQFSIGKIFRGEIVERQLVLKNPGTDTLVISRVDASCGCTGTVLTSPRIAPGKEGMLKISFNSRNFSGQVHKTVTISSNCTNARELVVNFTAEIIDEIIVTPPQFWVKDAEVGRAVELSLRIRNAGTAPLTLAKYRTTLKGFILTLPSSPIAPGKEVELKATFTPTAAVPFLAEGVFIETSNPRRQELYVPVYGNTKEFKFD